MKFALVRLLAIALNAGYAIASFTSNLAPGWTQPSPGGMADQPSPPGNGTPGGTRTPGGTHLDMPPPPDTGTSGSQRTPGGIRRRESPRACKPTDEPLTALIPENGEGLTTVENPVFWFYIPYAPEDIQSIEFSLHNRDETTTLYRTSLQLSKTPGVIGIALPPSSGHSLKLNESYHWRFVVNCNPKATPEDNINLDGWVTRVQPSSNQVTWYDELTNLAKRYLSEPQNPEVKKAWAELLKSVGLEGLAQAPVVSPVSNLKHDSS